MGDERNRLSAFMQGKGYMFSHKILTLWTEDQLNEADRKILRAPCAEAPVPFDAEMKKVILKLTEAFLERDEAVGLAAPQIGVNRRIIAFRCRNFDDKDAARRREDYEILVNPRITQLRGEPVIGEEGCLSCPDIRVEIERYPEIKVRALDMEGRKVSKRYLDFVARVVQHEMDHLDGKLIVDYDGSVLIPKKRQDFFEKFFQDK
jgi:peptide deformylase